MPLLLERLLRCSAIVYLLLPVLAMMTSTAADLRQSAPGCSESCYCSLSSEGFRTVRCSRLGLTHVPPGLPNDTHRLYLDGNLLASLPPDAFSGLLLLAELDLSHNQLTSLEPGAFRGLAPSLHSLDLSSNRLTTLDPTALGGLRAQANLTHNPWHCDCQLQVAMLQLELDPSSLAGVVCSSSQPEEVGAVGVALVAVASGRDLCAALQRTTDVAMLVTMFGWFSMVVSYLVCYVRHNQEDARRHLEYLKSLPSRQHRADDTSTLSTMV